MGKGLPLPQDLGDVTHTGRIFVPLWEPCVVWEPHVVWEVLTGQETDRRPVAGAPNVRLLPSAGQPSSCSCGASFLHLRLGASCLWPFGWWEQTQDVDSGVEFIPGGESAGLGCEGCTVMGHQAAVHRPCSAPPERSHLDWPWTL